MNVFVGLSKFGYFVIGQVVEQCEQALRLNNVARMYEIQNEQGRIALQFHPDPYFMSEQVSIICLSDFVMYRICVGDDKVVRDYQEFLTKVNMQRAGLWTGQMNPTQAKKVIQEGSF